MTLRLLLMSLLATGVASVTAHADNATIISQNFDLLTEGSADAPSADAETAINPDLTGGQEWKGKGLHQAGGALAVMQFEQSDWLGTEILQGYVQTPYTDVRLDQGKFTVRFRARSLDMESTTLKIEVYDPYTTNNLDSKDLELTGEWQELSATLSHIGYGNHLAYMQMAALDGNWILDDFSIEQVYETVMPPMIHFAKDVTYDQFTGYWNPVPMATGYKLSAFSLDKEGNRVYLVKDVLTADCEHTVSGTETGVQYYYTVKSVSDRYESVEAEPRAVNVPLTTLDKPVALDAENVTYNGFTARWEPTFRAMSYIVNLKRSHVASEDEQFMVLHEDFNKCTGYEGYPDMPVPFYSNLDDYTNMPGWKAENGPVTLTGMFGLDNMWKKYEEIKLTSPAIDLSSSEGCFTVKVKVKGTAGQTLNITSGDVVESRTLSSDIEELTFDFTNGTAATVLKFEFDGEGYLFFDDIYFYQLVKAGNLITENVGNYDTNEDVTEYQFRDLNAHEGDIFLYTVTAWSYSFSEDGTWGPNIYSESSEPISVVMPAMDGIESVALSTKTSVRTEGDKLVITTPKASTVELYNASGVMLGRYHAEAGETRLTSPASGLVIARVGASVFKLMVK